MSVDFLVRRAQPRHGPPQYHVFAGGAQGELVLLRRESELVENMADLQEALVRERGAPLADPLAPLDGPASAVVMELAFNRDSGRWVFHCLRTKLQPNFISVVFETMQQIAEKPITEDDLRKLAMRPPQ